MKTKNVFAVCSMFVLCACAAGPDYQRPKTPQTEDYTAKNDYLSSETHIALGKELTAEWWTLFSSESINNTIQQALQDNYTLAAAKARLAQAQEAVKSKSGELLPQISLLGVTGAQKYGVAQFGPSNFSVPAYSYYELGPQANWTPDIFGGTRRSIEWQKALANHQAYQLKAAYLTLTSNIVAQVIEIAVTKGKIETVEQMIALDRKQRKLTEASFEAGAATKLDILKAENQLNDDLALLPPLQQNLKLAEHALSVLVGKAPSEWTVPDFTLSDLMLPKELPVSLPSELVHKRPDILAAEANLQAASAAVGVATANLYPSLLITGNTLQESLALHSLFNGANNAWALAANLTAPLFSGGTLSAEKR
ncbi:MAG: efflux transporter outer membrane subunit, partial [Pseudomonadota bacterium]